jgi:hypothetical protein
MSGTPHPAAVVHPTGSNIAKEDVIADDKLHNRRVADVDEIRNGDWSGQYGVLFVASLDGWFKVDTSDTTTADNGTSVIVDANGLRFKKVSTGERNTRTITTDGDLTLLTNDEIVILAPAGGAAARTITIPAGTAKGLDIYDGNGSWNASDVTTFAGAGTINGLASWPGTATYGRIHFEPIGSDNLHATNS